MPIFDSSQIVFNHLQFALIRHISVEYYCYAKNSLVGVWLFMKKISLFLALFFTIGLMLVAVSPVLAQGEPEATGFSNVKIWVNPEYDDPRLLVMMEGKITGATPPATVRFLVPQAAEMYSAGSKNAFGEYSGGPPSRAASNIGFWDEISYVAKDETFRMEYYDPVISEQPNRTFTYEFHPVYPISGLQIIIQQPKRATNFAVQAADGTTGRQQTDPEGFSTIVYDYPMVAAGSTLSFQVSYTKTDNKPSLQGASPAQSSSSGSSTPPPADLLWVGVTVLAVLTAGILWAMRANPKRKRASRPQPKASATRPTQSKGSFCRKCGNPLKSSDKFCTGCGARV